MLSTAKDIHPTDLSFHKDFYLSTKNKSVICNYNEHVWADTKLYDEQLNEVAKLPLTDNGVDKILDFYSRFVVTENIWGICIYELNPVRRDGIDCYDVKEIRYRCSADVSPKSVELRLDNTCLDYTYFDVLQKKFIIDVEDNKTAYIKESSKDYYDPWSDYSLIDDGLDSEASAFGGIVRLNRKVINNLRQNI